MTGSCPETERETTSALFVDLDETLIATDTVQESLLIALREQPGILLAGLPLLARSRATFKDYLIQHGLLPDVTLLPYRADVLAFLRKEKERGRPLILATATHRHIADRVARHLALFDKVLASDADTNVKGKKKLLAIRRMCTEQGWNRFAYMGDSRADLAIWQEADDVLAVDPSPAVRRGLAGNDRVRHIFSSGHSRLRVMWQALRPHQWVKNVLIFVPLLLAHRWTDEPTVARALLAFVAFSAVSSAIYLINDMLDIPFDRAHPIKRRRPFAAGHLPLTHGLWLIGGLLLATASICILLYNYQSNWRFPAAITAYLAATLAYSLALKRKPILDVFLLASFYTMRMMAGGWATDVKVSEWLLAFSGFLFLSLAFAKRYAELRRMDDPPAPALTPGRGYQMADLGILETLGPTSGFMAVLVLALYINNDPVPGLYRHPAWMWLLCPLILYWITRLWFLAKRGVLADDPLLFAFTDRTSLFTGALALLFLMLAI